MTTSDGRCVGCEKRRKIMQQAWEAARNGDYDTYHRLMRSVLKSTLGDLSKLKDRVMLK